MKLEDVVLSRGSLAAKTGVNIETIRYYENSGLMPDPKRSAGGHRVYNHSSVKRLFFIRRARELGFTLKEIRDLLQLVDGGNYTCVEVRERTSAHLADVTKKILDLRKVEKTLKSMVAKCDGGLVPGCAIVDALYLH